MNRVTNRNNSPPSVGEMNNNNNNNERIVDNDTESDAANATALNRSVAAETNVNSFNRRPLG